MDRTEVGSGHRRLIALRMAFLLAFTMFLSASQARGTCPPSAAFLDPWVAAYQSQYNDAVVADFNADGALDVALTFSSGFMTMGGVAVAGHGTGEFVESRTTYLTGTQNRIYTSDLDRDGLPDLLMISSPGTVRVFLNSLGLPGAFTEVPGLQLPTDSGALACGDFNGDQIVDVAIIGGDRLSICLGAGSGGVWGRYFLSPTVYPISHYMNDVVAGDLDRDGILDIAISDGAPGLIHVLLGNGLDGVGDGTFTEIGSLSGGLYCSGVALGDFNNDGVLDVASLIPGEAGGATVLLGVSPVPGEYTASLPIVSAAGTSPRRIALGDFDRDGTLDLAVAGGGANVVPSLAILRNVAIAGHGTGTFVAYEVESEFAYAGPIAAADFNADGSPDLFLGGAIPDPRTTNYRDVVACYLNGCLPADLEVPQFDAVADVPRDQGGWVKLSWHGSGYDVDGRQVINEYWIWRATPDAVATSLLAAGEAQLLDGSSTPRLAELRPLSRLAGSNLFWEFVAAQPAGGLQDYSYVARTTADSSALGNPMTTFFVQARGTDGVSHWDSAPDSGYSVDNLAPKKIKDIGGYYAPPSSVTIHWSPNRDEDLSHYAVYSGPSVDFEPTLARRFGETVDTTLTASGVTRTTFFKVTAFDIHGNESEPIVLAPAQITGIERLGAPTVAFLDQNHPNPFNPETSIEYGLPEAGQVTIRVYAPSGRLVRTLLREVKPAGAYSARWDGRDDRGRSLPSGVYVARLESGRATRMIKMVLTR